MDMLFLIPLAMTAIFYVAMWYFRIGSNKMKERNVKGLVIGLAAFLASAEVFAASFAGAFAGAFEVAGAGPFAAEGARAGGALFGCGFPGVCCIN